MTLLKSLMLGLLAGSLLFLPGAAAAQGVQSSTDDKGTIHIGNTGPASKEKSGAVKPEGQAGEPKGAEKQAGGLRAPSGQTATEPPPPGMVPPASRRQYGPAAEARKKMLMERRQAVPPATGAPVKKAPPAQPEQ